MSRRIYMGFWLRLVAVLVDSVLLTLITLPLLLALYGDQLLQVEPAPRELGQLFLGPGHFLISYVLPIVVTVALWRRFAATPGKMAFRATIVDADSGLPPSTRQCLIRYLGYILCSLSLGLGFLWAAFDPRKQGWHDKLANTVVIMPSEQGVEARIGGPLEETHLDA
ncbi:RDD family protein [Gallaecimonas sp. GXIMD4217]|uniref:RDD family protein n=1 Tax=Gallaecimonas sp. GXIMD4217 TaxID=3131927 RepID=UPI00311B351A